MALDNELFLPEPAPRDVKYTVISVDDHVVEPPHTFEGRVPAALADRAPRIVETRKGHQVWEFEGRRYTQVGMNAVAGRRPESVKLCTLEDHSTIDTRYRIGVDNIMIEVDYPHGDSTWPDTQLVIEKAWGHVPVDELRAMCCENAAALYRHPLPDVVVPTGP